MTQLIYIHPNAFPSREANSIAVLAMCEAFAAEGVQVQLFGYLAAEGAAMKAAPLPAGLRLELRPAPREGKGHRELVRAALHDAPPNAVVLTRMPQIALASCLRRFQTVLELHSPVSQARKSVYVRAMVLSLSRHLAAIVVINGALQRATRRDLPLYRGPLLTIPSGARDTGAPATDGEGARYDVGFVGSANPGKGVDFVLDLAARSPDVSFAVVADTASAPAVVARAAQLANLTLLAPMDNALVGRMLGAFRVAVAPYAATVFGARNTRVNLAAWMSPLKVVEYMAAGRCIVASRLPAVEELVTDGVNAVLREAGDVDAWTVAIRALLADSERREAMGRNARTSFEQGLSWRARARRLLEALEHGPTVTPTQPRSAVRLSP